MNTIPFLIALAEAGASAPQAAEQQLLDVDGTVLVMLGLFLVVVFVLTQALWKPYLRVRDQRVSRVDGYREEAARLEREAATRLARVEAQLAEARRTAASDRAKARAAAQDREQQIVAAAQADTVRKVADARAQLDKMFAAERARLDEGAKALGREITEKVLGRRVAS